MAYSAKEFIHRVILSLLLQTAIATLSQKHPEITFITDNQYPNEGADVGIQCTVNNTNGVIMRWIKIIGGHQPVILTENFFSKDPRYNFTYDVYRDSITYFLKMKNFQKPDEAKYQCVLFISLDERIKAEVQVRLRKAPNIYSTSTPYEAQVGGTIRLQCFATGVPEPQITWGSIHKDIRSYNEVIRSGSVMTIPNARKDHQGTYFCAAQNGFDLPDLRYIEVKMQFPPEVEVVISQVDRSLNFTIDFECRIQAYPIPKVIWKKNNNHIYSEFQGSTNITNLIVNEHTTISKLELIFIEEEPFGFFSCIAVNVVGKSEKGIYVDKGVKIHQKS